VPQRAIDSTNGNMRVCIGWLTQGGWLGHNLVPWGVPTFSWKHEVYYIEIEDAENGEIALEVWMKLNSIDSTKSIEDLAKANHLLEFC
jgi:hypothetical protein